MDKLSIDGVINSYAIGMLTAALNHNAAIVQLGSEIVAVGSIKPSKLKDIRRAFDNIHKQYSTEAERITATLEEELKTRGVSL